MYRHVPRKFIEIATMLKLEKTNLYTKLCNSSLSVHIHCFLFQFYEQVSEGTKRRDKSLRTAATTWLAVNNGFKVHLVLLHILFLISLHIDYIPILIVINNKSRRTVYMMLLYTHKHTTKFKHKFGSYENASRGCLNPGKTIDNP